jgi:UDP-glucose 4-epimerase
MKQHPKKNIAIIGATSPSGKSIAEKSGNDNLLTLTYRDARLLPEQFKNKSNIKLLHYDLENKTPPEISIFKQCDIVIWTAHIKHADEKKQLTLNTKAIQSFLSIVKQTNIRRFIYLSSGGSIYGPPFVAPIVETHPLKPVTPYGRTKLAIENILIDAHKKTGMELAILRPGNIYGEDSLTGRSKGIIASYINSSLNNESFTIIGNSLNIRDYIYIQDLVEAVKFAVDSSRKFLIWNVGTGIGHSVEYIMHYITEMTHLKPSIIHHKKLTTKEIPVNILNINRICQETPWRYNVSLEQGLEVLLKPLIKEKK